MANYAVTDLHGRYDLWEQIKAFVKPEDTIYFLGDAGDRGPDGWKLITTLLTDPQVVYLKGNHEQMLADAIDEYRRYGTYGDLEFYRLARNGGEKTFNDWLVETREDFSFCGKLKNLPYCIEYRNEQGLLIWLSHSGCPPLKQRFTGKNIVSERSAIWDRDHCDVEHWGKEDLDMIIVHGHTPIPFLIEGLDVEIEPGAYWYCDDHKVCLDTGAYLTGFTCLFDLDTFDEHIFGDEDFYKSIEADEGPFDFLNKI